MKLRAVPFVGGPRDGQVLVMQPRSRELVYADAEGEVIYRLRSHWTSNRLQYVFSGRIASTAKTGGFRPDSEPSMPARESVVCSSSETYLRKELACPHS